MGCSHLAAPEADPVALNHRQAPTNPSASSPSGSALTHRDPPHPIPIEHIDPDALKVVRRLKRYGHTAYLVGGCVRDLLLGRTPKDFDIGTSARPRQVKHLFRNSRIIGRRFRLAHIVFGKKVIEVATFRATHEAPELPEETGEVDLETTPSGGKPVAGARPGAPPANDKDEDDLLIKSDNVFGTPEQDAFRRDFTVNGLFYDPETQQVIDHVGGMADLERRVLRTIGDPEVRFKEDPVRIVRAVKFAARLQFAIEPKTFDAMIRNRQELAKAAPPRLAEEVIRLCQGGAGAESFRLLYELGVLQHIAPSVSAALARANEKATPDAGAAGLFWRHLEAIDRWPNGPLDLSRAVALSAVYGPVYRAALEENPQMAARDPGVLFFNAIRPAISERLLSRREADRMKLIYVAQRRLETAPGAGDGPMPPAQGGQQQPGQGGSNDPRRRRRRRGGGAKGLATRDYFREAVAFFRVDSMAKGKSPDVWERWEALLPQAPPTREVLPFRRREESMPLGAEPSEDEPLPTQQEIDAVNRLPDDEDFSQRRRRRRGGGRVSNDNRERQRMARTEPGDSGGVPETPRSDAEFDGGPTGGGIVERPSVETSSLPKLTKPKRARERQALSVANEPAPPPVPKLSPSERIAAAMASDAPLINPYTNRAYVPRKVLDDMPMVAMAATATSAAAAAGAGLGMGVSIPILAAPPSGAASATTSEPYSLDEFEGDDDVEPEVPDRIPSGPSSNAPPAPGAPRPQQQGKPGEPGAAGDGPRRRRRRGRRGRGRGGRPGEAGGNATPADGTAPASAAPPRSEGNGGNNGGNGSAT